MPSNFQSVSSHGPANRLQETLNCKPDTASRRYPTRQHPSLTTVWVRDSRSSHEMRFRYPQIDRPQMNRGGNADNPAVRPASCSPDLSDPGCRLGGRSRFRTVTFSGETRASLVSG